MSTSPILYSFRRCPYAMRARMALWMGGHTVELREVKLADKPAAMVEASPKATVPVLVLADGTVIDESIAIMRWALSRSDPESWLGRDDDALLERIDGPFKHHLDRYKYFTRYDTTPHEHRANALSILSDLDARLEGQKNLAGDARGLIDIATFPFIRQFANHDRAWFDAQPIGNLQSWLERHLASDLFAASMNKHTVWQEGDKPITFGPQF